METTTSSSEKTTCTKRQIYNNQVPIHQKHETNTKKNSNSIIQLKDKKKIYYETTPSCNVTMEEANEKKPIIAES
jgi:hypothetical protein